MSEQIKKSDISEKDVFGWIIEGAKLAEEQVRATNNEISKTAKIFKDSLSGKQLNNVAELKASEQAIISTNNLYKQKLKLEADLISIQARRTNAEVQLNKAVERSNREEAKKIQQQEKLTSAYSRVDGWLKNLTKEYRELAIRQELSGKLSEAEIKRMTTLEGRIRTYDSALKTVDATMGKGHRTIGLYSSAYNGLGNSVNQLTREMPAFANGAKTGFMALSNNLPIFFDEIGRIKQANKDLIAQGQPVKSVFSQLGSAIFSLGTVLSVGVTLLTVYGAQLVEWAFNAENAAEKQERFNKALEDGNKEASAIIKSIEKKLNWDKISRKEAIETLKEEIKIAYERKKNYLEEEESAKRRINNAGILESVSYNSELKMQKERKKINYDRRVSEEEQIRLMKVKLEDLQLEEYRENKSNNSKKNKTKTIEKETKVIEYQVKALERLNEVNRVRFADVEAVDDALLKRSKTEQDVYLLMAELTENERLIREARITKIKADLKIELDSIEARRKAYEEMRKLDPSLKADFETSEAYVTKITLQAQKDIKELEKENNKQRWKDYKDYTDLVTDYAIKKSNQRIEQIEKESQSAQKNYDLLVELAKNGNIQAQQSLAQQQKLIIESEKKKKEELQKQEIIKLGGTAIDVFSNKVANNDPQPLLSTIKDITLLKAFISSLASFDVGSERTFADSGSGIDGKGGRMAIVHPNEKIFTEEHSKKIGFDISNNEVADIISLYKQGTLVPINKVGAFAGTSYDLKPLLKEVQELKDVIKNQPIPNLEVGRITRDLYEFGQKTVKGNTTTIDTYQIRKRR